MKAHEILREYEWDFGNSDGGMGVDTAALAAGGLLAKGAAKLFGPKGAKGPGAVPEPAGAKGTKGGAAEPHPSSGKSGPGAAPAETKSSKLDKFKHYKETQRAKLDAMETKTKAWFGPFFSRLFSFIGLLIPTVQLYCALDEANEGAKKGELTPEELIEVREFLFGVYQTQLPVPLVAKFLLNTSMIVRVVRLIKNIGAVISAPLTFGASFAAAIATDVFIGWFQQWLGSEAGKKWLTDYMFDIVKTFGKAGSNAWDAVVAEFNKSQATTQPQAPATPAPNVATKQAQAAAT